MERNAGFFTNARKARPEAKQATGTRQDFAELGLGHAAVTPLMRIAPSLHTTPVSAAHETTCSAGTSSGRQL